MFEGDVETVKRFVPREPSGFQYSGKEPSERRGVKAPVPRDARPSERRGAKAPVPRDARPSERQGAKAPVPRDADKLSCHPRSVGDSEECREGTNIACPMRVQSPTSSSSAQNLPREEPPAPTLRVREKAEAGDSAAGGYRPCVIRVHQGCRNERHPRLRP